MIDQEELIKKVLAYDDELDVKKLKKALRYSKEAHGTQKRASGEPYYSHPLEVANVLVDMKLDANSIITALLHDTVEDTHVTLEDIEKEFGREVMGLVDGVTKLAKIEFQTEHARFGILNFARKNNMFQLSWVCFLYCLEYFCNK